MDTKIIETAVANLKDRPMVLSLSGEGLYFVGLLARGILDLSAERVTGDHRRLAELVFAACDDVLAPVFKAEVVHLMEQFQKKDETNA